MTKVVLTGCASEPLIHYLKALGIFRLMAEQMDSEIFAAWEPEGFAVVSSYDGTDIVAFLLDSYRPTPIIAPWNGGSGFYPKDRQDAINKIAQSTSPRFTDYRNAISVAREIVSKASQSKVDILRDCRRSLPDAALVWLDAAYVLGDEKPAYPPLLGTGGNDGRLEFTNTFMARITELILTENARDRDTTERLLHASLWLNSGVRLDNCVVGQFHPGGGGGPNGTEGPVATVLANPWDYVLALEGAVLLAGAAVRRLAPGAKSMASFPFTVGGSLVGYGTAAEGENVRAEMWLPLWSRPASFREISHVLGEGRVTYGGPNQFRSVRSGFDFARAVAELGVDRGIDGFQRFGFIERNGRAYLATSLGKVAVDERRSMASRISESSVDRWLDRFRRETRDTGRTPARISRARRAVEDAAFSLCLSSPEYQRDRLEDTLIALGRAEREIALSPRFRDDHEMKPLTGLSVAWANDLADGTPEYSIAAALASIYGDGERGPIRANMEPVRLGNRGLAWSQDDTGVAWGGRSLTENLGAILVRRLLDTTRQKRDTLGGERSLGGFRGGPGHAVSAPLKAVAAFLSPENAVDDQRIEDLLFGLCLIDWLRMGRRIQSGVARDTGSDSYRLARVTTTTGAAIPPVYALLKLVFLPNQEIRRGNAPIRVAPEPRIVNLLRSGRAGEALEIACRRLRASRLPPIVEQFDTDLLDGPRLAASLLIPVSQSAIRRLCDMVIEPVSED